MAGVKAPWWKWYPAEYLADVSNLDIEVQGAWMRLICHAMNNGEDTGVVKGNLMWVSTDLRRSLEESWNVLVTLSLLNICTLTVDVGNGFETLDEEWLKTNPEHKKPEMFWKFRLLARRVERDAIKREQELIRKSGTADNRPSSRGKARKMAHLPEGRPGRRAVSLARVEPEPEPEPDKTTYSPSLDGLEDGDNPKQTRRAKKTGGRVKSNTEMMERIGGWFGRRKTTLWSLEESKKLKAINPQPDELDTFEEYYGSEHPEIRPYRRQNVETLLNNWTKDLDKARNKLEQFPGNGKNLGHVPQHVIRHGADLTMV